MTDEDKLRKEILFAGATGDIEPDAAHAMLRVLAGAPILKASPSPADRAMGRDAIYQTLDTKGNVLVAGENYMFRGQKVKVLREVYGSGNMLDTYQRVYFLDSSLEEDWVVVQGSFPNGVLGRQEYRSRFEPIPKK